MIDFAKWNSALVTVKLDRDNPLTKFFQNGLCKLHFTLTTHEESREMFNFMRNTVFKDTVYVGSFVNGSYDVVLAFVCVDPGDEALITLFK